MLRYITDLFRKSPKFETVAEEWLEVQFANKSANTRFGIGNRLSEHVYPVIGHKPIHTVRSGDIIKILLSYQVSAPHSAKSLMQHLRRIFAYADAKLAYDLANPVRDSIKVLLIDKEGGRHAYIEPNEMPNLLSAATKIESRNPGVQVAFLLIAYTAVRRREAMEATWDEFDLDAALWSIPGARMKTGADFLIPLAPQVVSMLRKWQKYTGGQGRLFNVFSGSALHLIKVAGYERKMTLRFSQSI